MERSNYFDDTNDKKLIRNYHLKTIYNNNKNVLCIDDHNDFAKWKHPFKPAPKYDGFFINRNNNFKLSIIELKDRSDSPTVDGFYLIDYSKLKPLLADNLKLANEWDEFFYYFKLNDNNWYQINLWELPINWKKIENSSHYSGGKLRLCWIGDFIRTKPRYNTNEKVNDYRTMGIDIDVKYFGTRVEL